MRPLLAYAVLTFGILIFTVEEIWYSEWIKKVGLYRNAIISVIGLVSGVATILVGQWISRHRDTGIRYLERDRIAFVEQFSLIKPAARVSFDTFFCAARPHMLHPVMVDSKGVCMDDPERFADPDAEAIQFYKKDIDKLRKAALLGEVKWSDLDIGKVIWKTPAGAA